MELDMFIFLRGFGNIDAEDGDSIHCLYDGIGHWCLIIMQLPGQMQDSLACRSEKEGFKFKISSS
jgi:hypothetical protein